MTGFAVFMGYALVFVVGAAFGSFVWELLYKREFDRFVRARFEYEDARADLIAQQQHAAAIRDGVD